MAIDFLLQSQTYRETARPEDLRRRSIVVLHMQHDYTLLKQHITQVLRHLRKEGFPKARINTVLADADLYKYACRYLICSQAEREELLKSQEPWRIGIESLLQDGISRWKDLRLGPNVPTPILTVSDASMTIRRAKTQEPQTLRKPPKKAKTSVPPKPARLITRKQLSKEDLVKARVGISETRFVFKAVRETSLPFEFVFSVVKPLAEKRITRAKKNKLFRLDEEFLRNALKRYDSGFTVKDDVVHLIKRRLKPGKKTQLKKR